MRNHIDILLPFVAIASAPGVAFAESAPLLASASNGPWIALAVVGMVRAMLCLGNGSPCDEPRDDGTI